MKLLIVVRNCFIFIFILSWNSVPSSAQSKETATYQVFYDALAPYGKWLYDKNYGYVWTPAEGAKFRPYFTNGYWAMTDAGCTWISNYPWGWAPFHYGRWTHDALYHWIWIPGNKWAAAWVVWKTDGNYTGWTVITPGTSLTAAVAPTYYVPADWWVFIKKGNLLKKDFQRSAEPSRSNANLVKDVPSNLNKHTGDKEDENYMSGPRAVDFQKATGQRVALYSLHALQKPGKATVAPDQIGLYMPVVEGTAKGGEAKPAKSVTAEHPLGKVAAISMASGTSSGKTPAKKTTTKKKK